MSCEKDQTKLIRCENQPLGHLVRSTYKSILCMAPPYVAPTVAPTTASAAPSYCLLSLCCTHSSALVLLSMPPDFAHQKQGMRLLQQAGQILTRQTPGAVGGTSGGVLSQGSSNLYNTDALRGLLSQNSSAEDNIRVSGTTARTVLSGLGGMNWTHLMGLSVLPVPMLF